MDHSDHAIVSANQGAMGPATAVSPAAVYLARLAEGSRPTIRTALETIAGIASNGTVTADQFPWHMLRYEHTQAIRAVLADRFCFTTANHRLAALRGVLGEAWRLKQMSTDDYQRAIDVKAVRGIKLPAGRSLSEDELARLFGVCAADEAAAGARDGAILALLYLSGLRRDEAVSLDLSSIQAGALKVLGKGNKERMCPLPQASKALLRRWIQIRGGEPGPLLCPVLRTGKVVIRRMTAEALVLRLQARGASAGTAHFSPHDLRRSFVGDLLDKGADLSVVQKLAGHSNIQTTAGYDRRGEKAKARAVELMSVPVRSDMRRNDAGRPLTRSER